MTVESFPPSQTFTVEQALNSALQVEGVTDVLIVMSDADDNIIIRSNRLTRQEALWLAEKGRLHALGFDI